MFAAIKIFLVLVGFKGEVAQEPRLLALALLEIMCDSISTFTTPPRAGPQGITSSSLPYPGLAQGSPAWPQKYHPTYMAPLTFITGHFLTPGHHIFIHRPMGIHKWEKRMWVPWVRVVLGSNQPQEGNKHLEFFIVDFLCDSNQWYTTPCRGRAGTSSTTLIQHCDATLKW